MGLTSPLGNSARMKRSSSSRLGCGLPCFIPSSAPPFRGLGRSFTGPHGGSAFPGVSARDFALMPQEGKVVGWSMERFKNEKRNGLADESRF